MAGGADDEGLAPHLGHEGCPRGLARSWLSRLPRDLERAIVFLDTQDSVPPERGTLQAKLDAVIAEQDDRARLAADA